MKVGLHLYEHARSQEPGKLLAHPEPRRPIQLQPNPFHYSWVCLKMLDRKGGPKSFFREALILGPPAQKHAAARTQRGSCSCCRNSPDTEYRCAWQLVHFSCLHGNPGQIPVDFQEESSFQKQHSLRKDRRMERAKRIWRAHPSRCANPIKVCEREGRHIYNLSEKASQACEPSWRDEPEVFLGEPLANRGEPVRTHFYWRCPETGTIASFCPTKQRSALLDPIQGCHLRTANPKGCHVWCLGMRQRESDRKAWGVTEGSKKGGAPFRTTLM